MALFHGVINVGACRLQGAAQAGFGIQAYGAIGAPVYYVAFFYLGATGSV